MSTSSEMETLLGALRDATESVQMVTAFQGLAGQGPQEIAKHFMLFEAKDKRRFEKELWTPEVAIGKMWSFSRSERARVGVYARGGGPLSLPNA